MDVTGRAGRRHPSIVRGRRKTPSVLGFHRRSALERRRRCSCLHVSCLAGPRSERPHFRLRTRENPYDPPALSPLRPLRRRRTGLRVDLDQVSRPLRRPRRVRPDRGAGDLPRRHVPGRDGGEPVDGPRARSAQGIRRGGVRRGRHRPGLSRSLPVGHRPGLRLHLSGPGRLGRPSHGQVDPGEPADPAAVGAARRHLPADGVGGPQDSPGQAGQDAGPPLFLQQPRRGGGGPGRRLLPRLAGGPPRNTARGRDAQLRRRARHARR